MQKDIKLLVELQGIDTVILRRKTVIDSLPSKLLSVEHLFKEAQSQYDKHKQQLQLLEKKKKDKEREIEDINERINKLKTRTSEIKTNKEYQAHLKEIEAIEKERYKVEDEVLAAMEDIDALSKEMKKEESKVKAEKEKTEALKRAVEKEIAEAEKELSELKIKRAEIADSVDREIYDEYMRALERCEGLAVVDAKEEICHGCNMHIPPQLFVEIKKNEEIIHCPQCRRILYWSQPPTGEKKTE